ncbi:DNA cytosine methyltransferase [Helicobacter rodentium]|uniref:DNA cytosine methyltransferase n=4 Tax=Helicobacter TaxID=209 RepID=UPI002630A747|nr:DNA cytosine methyltransferase [Helicobacter rodentium]
MVDLFSNQTQQKNHFSYEWYLKDLPKPRENAYKVFGTFISCGGTSLGAKLAGFNHLGGVEISEKIAAVYKKNLNPKYLFVEDIREFKKRAIKEEIPEELYNLDILEGSPPCTTFSSCGEKQKGFGKLKIFAEGGKLQTLDDLVFEYAELACILKPKVVFFENVAGFKASYSKKHYKKVIEILSKEFYLNEYLLNAKYMGLPQSRTRFFIIATRKDLGFSSLNLNYGEPIIPFSEFAEFAPMSNVLKNEDKLRIFIKSYKLGRRAPFTRDDDGFFTRDNPLPCLINKDSGWSVEYLRRPTARERVLASSFPLDYDFGGKKNMIYGTGMCVAPLVAANIFTEIKTQILEKI